MRKTVLLALTLIALSAPLPAVAADSTAGEAFERLKGLAGTWNGTSEGDDSDVTHVFELSAAGTVVMETMFPGTDHEMINMYHLDGDSLMLTHYCAGGNQPRMRLAEGSTVDDMVFDFAGGTNLDPAKDSHIHNARLVFGEDGLESRWTGWSGGKEAHTMVFSLRRGED